MSRLDDLDTAIDKGEAAIARLIAARPLTARQVDALIVDYGSLVDHLRERARLDKGELLPLIAEGLRLTRAIASHFTIPAPVLPSGIWSYSQGGTSFSGRSPMPASFTDDSAPWGVAVTELKDARGENAGPGATVALSVDDADVVALTDNGDGTGTVAPGPLATSDTPASTAIHATITNTNGSSFTVDDVITVVGADAVTGTFGFTPPA